MTSPRARARSGWTGERPWRWTLALFLCASLLGCTRTGSATARGGGVAAREWHYRVRIDPALTRIDAEICFEGAVPRELRAGKSEGAERLIYARWLEPGPVRRLRVERGRVQIDSDEAKGCIGYAVKLDEGGSLDAAVRRVGRDLIASPNIWLWRPERRAEQVSVSLELSLPDGVAALLPWPELAGKRVLDAAAFRFDSYAAFGRFTPARSEHRGVQVEAALLDGEFAIEPAAALHWLSSGIDMLSAVEGGFPHKRLSALVVPAGDHDDPVPFGMVARGGGASLLLLVSADAQEQALLSDWVLPHELSHLLLPFIEREQAWLSEGLASYYQELLPARAGVQSERSAWTRLVRNLRDTARGGGQSVVEESAHMHLTHAYRKVYWGGAAYWLSADVRLRRASQGHASLDTVLATLRARGALARIWTARALLAELDEIAGSPLFSELREQAAAQSFPPFEPTLELLGVRGDSPLEFDDAAPAAEIRRALFSRRD